VPGAVIVYIADVTLYAIIPVSNGHVCGQVLAVAEWKTPPLCESLLWNWNVLFTPTTSLATSGEYAVFVSNAAPLAIWMVTQLGGVHPTAAVALEEVLVLHEVGLQTTNW